MNNNIKRNIKKMMSVVLAVAIIFVNSSVSIMAKTATTDIELQGYMIAAEDAENFLRYGADGISMTPVSWEISNIVLNNSMLSMTVDKGLTQENVSGYIYLGFNQNDGYNYVADINGSDVETLYFSVCEKIEEQFLFSDSELDGYGIVWYLYDSIGELYVFEQDFTNEVIDQELLNCINVVAPKENDTQWFVHKMEPVVSRVIEPENEVSLFTSIGSYYTVDKGNIYENEFYLNGMLIETTCQPFLELVPGSDAYNGSTSSTWSMNLAIHQKVTNDGEDITGKVGNVYSLKNIDYSAGLKGNAVFSSFTPTYRLKTWGTISPSSLYTGIRSFVPSKVSKTMTIAQILAEILTSGTQMSVSSGTYSTTSKGYNVKVSSSYYIANDTENGGDFVGCSATIATEDPTLSRSTSATFGVECNYTVVGGSTEGQTETLSYNKSFITNK